jgi:polyketide biosynthesis acyl carrier protein
MTKNRERVLAELTHQLRSNVEGLENLEAKDLDLSGTFEDLGASSLDMVEVVSTTNARLGVALDRKAFADLKNLDELVGLFEKALDKKG